MDSEPEILSSRQSQILKLIIEEYIVTAQPVGSETLEKKFSLAVSPATIRNDMVRLAKKGFLMQPHTSSGRSPTSKALRYYVDHMLQTRDLSVVEEVAVKEKIWDHRQKVDKLLREATKTLAEKTHSLAVTATDDGDLYYAGASHILDMPEFYNFELTHKLFDLLDRYDFWWETVIGHDEPFYILLGDEFRPDGLLSQCGFVYSRFTSPHAKGAIGVVGPVRLNYITVIPTVRYMGSLIGDLTNW